MSWSPVAGAAGYKLYVRQGVAYGAGVDIGPKAADADGLVHYITSGLALDQMNYFTVTSYSAAGTESGYSNELSLMLPSSGIGVTGTVLKAGPAGLVPASGVTVRAYVCRDRTTCLDSPGVPAASVNTDMSGAFALSLGTAGTGPQLLLLSATVDGALQRSLVCVNDGAAWAGGGASVLIDPIAESAVRLLDANGLAHYIDSEVQAVTLAVRAANTSSIFAGLTTADATNMAQTTAASAASVDRALQCTCPLNVDMNDTLNAATDMVYIGRVLLGLPAVPASFRALDRSIPADAAMAEMGASSAKLDVDRDGTVDVATDLVFITRHLLGLPPVPASFRDLSDLPSDDSIAAAIDGLCP